MRTITFRGLRTDGKGWAYGYYYEYSGKHIICWQNHSDNSTTDHFAEVISNSVGQFTGLNDKNGKEIYKGEILYNNDRKEHCIVKYSKEKAMFIVKYLESNDEFPLWESILNLCYSVGNIYENPELLEKKFAD